MLNSQHPLLDITMEVCNGLLFFITTVHTLAYQHICVNKTCVSTSWFSPQMEYLTPSLIYFFFFFFLSINSIYVSQIEFTIFPFKGSGVPRIHYTYCLLTCHSLKYLFFPPHGKPVGWGPLCASLFAHPNRWYHSFQMYFEDNVAISLTLLAG